MRRKLTKKDYERVQKLCLMDDILMKKCLEGHNECIELIIRIILNRDDLVVLSSSIQETLTGPAREVRLDIFATDKKGKKYDIEFQRAESGAKPKRARYNSSMIDVRSLAVGTKTFTKLPEVYVIFITETDVLKGGLPIYTIDRVINETGKKFGDASHIIYVNGSHRDSGTALGKLMHDLFCTEAEEMNYSPLADRVKHIKGTEKGVTEMSSAWEEELKVEAEKIAEKRAKQVAKEQKENFALKMLKAGKLALEEIVEYSGLSMTAVKRLAKTLNAVQ
ncbi:MAG: PD-(D/E)XK nuclease family transposase [Synergistaceae bacterium]|nr:PD-(D/E)XK nuclease family transposase [Synergistaceae bacterium]